GAARAAAPAAATPAVLRKRRRLFGAALVSGFLVIGFSSRENLSTSTIGMSGPRPLRLRTLVHCLSGTINIWYAIPQPEPGTVSLGILAVRHGRTRRVGMAPR